MFPISTHSDIMQSRLVELSKCLQIMPNLFNQQHYEWIARRDPEITLHDHTIDTIVVHGNVHPLVPSTAIQNYTAMKMFQHTVNLVPHCPTKCGGWIVLKSIPPFFSQFMPICQSAQVNSPPTERNVDIESPCMFFLLSIGANLRLSVTRSILN